MSRAAYDMLTARLRWPSPRVRWETARAIARSVEAGERAARDSLIDWISRRTLESEVAIGLGVIDGFGLENHFEHDELTEAIKVPSVLSDRLMAAMFGDFRRSSAARLRFSDDVDVALPDSVSRCFDRYRRFAVPPVFDVTLEAIEKSTGVPLVARWRHEWRWLQAMQERPVSEYPDHFFSPSTKGEIGSYDGAQREVFASAFLRTLHWAHRALGAPIDVMEHYSLIALTTNRGLARVGPRRRKPWARLTLPPRDDWRQEAEALWLSACSGSKDTELPISVNIRHAEKTGFFDHRMVLVAIPEDLPPPEDAPSAFKSMLFEDDRIFGGDIGPVEAGGRAAIDRPVALAQTVSPRNWGRFHIDLAQEITLLSPIFNGGTMTIETRDDEIVGKVGRRVVTRWHHWLAGWSPASPAEMLTSVPSITTARRDVLDRFGEQAGVKYGIWAHSVRGSRSDGYSPMDVSEAQGWVEP
ncbi:hypothetical protein [Qipengyuania flava]|jgi:hypothetical protein|uniref:hypothetical protein n=1 Tax=Qipengyuania flava TaxID=192812 RepID=UPI001C58E89C|nr:hypothetical protein [Qipengyuania flava]MBW3169421.1 hypothetical protein [Qipengyuania flava]MBY5966659.1 hypothetical protein [Qipengyuania flava]MBY6012983.1 hypothetical protein [Qipengyuania flava]MBY6027425.1 hypothetical protein [Qipengyuania flava]